MSDFHSRATSWGTKRALARKPRCNCTVCVCKRYAAGHSLYHGEVRRYTDIPGGGSLCWNCARGNHTKRLLAEASS